MSCGERQNPTGLRPDPVWIAIPARDEEERLPSCLRALAAQEGAAFTGCVILLNNCTDRSAEVLAGLAPSLPFPLDVVIADTPPAEANAGAARRRAMQRASRNADGAGVLLTTDADATAPPGWLAANLAALEAGADAVAGRAVIDPVEALAVPALLHEDDAREGAYAALLDALHARLDPDPADPLPRHDEESGASLAVRASAHDRAGGVPRLALGEDRGFVAALRRIDARVRHAPEVWVTVSGRLEGRAAGGMADTMRRRIGRQDALIDARLEPADAAMRRARCRAGLRLAWRDGIVSAGLHELLGLERAALPGLLQAPTFGQAWERAERRCASLRRIRVPVADLAQETERARTLLDAMQEPAG